MPMNSFYSLVLVGIVSLAQLSQAADSKPAPTPKRVVIQSIESDSITINTGSLIKVYKLDACTEFTYCGNHVKLKDLKPGMRVTITPAFDNRYAALVAARDAPVVPVPPPVPSAPASPQK
jgi:hypothetical protein